MTSPIVWIDNLSENQTETSGFYARYFGWAQAEVAGMQFQSVDKAQPFAALCDTLDGQSGWVPYFEVEDLQAETQRAIAEGARLIKADCAGPAGTASFLKDPGGAPFAVWKRA